MVEKFTEIPVRKYRAVLAFVTELSQIAHTTPGLENGNNMAVGACVVLDTMTGRGINISKIARCLSLPRSSVTRSVTHLDKIGWVRTVRTKHETMVWAQPPNEDFKRRRDVAIRRLLAGLCG